MDQLTDDRLLSLKAIARSLFWLNLPPVAMVLTVTILAVTDRDFDKISLYLFIPSLWLDVVVEVIYYLQFRRGRWLDSRPAWMFSVVIHSLFILLVVLIAILTESYTFLFFLLYPLQLLYSSYKGWKQLR